MAPPFGYGQRRIPAVGLRVVERWSDPLPGMVWVTEETCVVTSFHPADPILEKTATRAAIDTTSVVSSATIVRWAR